MKDNNVIIISDNRQKSEKFASKIILLRTYDSVAIFEKSEVVKRLEDAALDLILLHAEQAKDIDIIKELRMLPNLKNTTIIMLTEFYDEDMLCSAFDCGIDDFMDINTDNTELIMRIMWGLKKKKILDYCDKKSEVLKFIEETEPVSGFYKEKYTRKIFEDEYNKLIKNNEIAVFMMIATDLNSKDKISLQCLYDITKKTVRLNDLVGYAPDNRLYIFLYQTSEIGAKSIFDRISKLLPTDVTVSASAMKIASDRFSEAEHILNKNLGIALTKSNNLVFAAKKPEAKNYDNFDISFLSKNNLKNIKKNFLDKMEKIITPSFFKMQAIYEPKLFNTVITQICNERESRFIVKSKNFSSEIAIKYENYKKLIVEINNISMNNKHSQKYSYATDEFSAEMLEEIMQKVLEKFRSNLYDSEEEVL